MDGWIDHFPSGFPHIPLWVFHVVSLFTLGYSMKSQSETYIDSYEIPLSPHDMFPGVFHVDRVNPHSRAPTVPSTSRSLDL
jgi:hypothetical protein